MPVIRLKTAFKLNFAHFFQSFYLKQLSWVNIANADNFDENLVIW